MEFSQIAILFVVAGAFGVIAKILRQPLLVGYLFAGLTLGYMGVIGDANALESLGKVGVTLLLFLLGLEMNLKELPTIGKPALLTGLGQIAFTSVIGFSISRMLGFETLPSVYIAIALTFSSTIIMVKLLSEKKDLSSLYGRIAVGFLLVQDFVAVIILMFLSGFKDGGLGVSDYLIIGSKAAFLFFVVWYLSKKILPDFFSKVVGGSTELVFIASIAWALGVAAFVEGPLGFTLEIGGFLAGIALSNLPEHLQIAAKTRPLRDFFLIIFFLLLGSKLVIDASVAGLLVPAVVFSLFVLIGNPIIVLIIMGLLGYKKRTSFLAGLTVAQISEFSFIIVTIGATLGHISNSHVALVVLVGVITMTISTYAIMSADKIFALISKYLSFFEKKGIQQTKQSDIGKLMDHFVVVGCDRTGSKIVKYLKRKKLEYIVVDFNPSVYRRLSRRQIPIIFGDISDPDVFESAMVESAKYIISSVSNLSANLSLLERVKDLKAKPATIFTADTQGEAMKLYNMGALYCMVPDIVAGDYITHLFAVPGMGLKRFRRMGKTHYKYLLSRK